MRNMANAAPDDAIVDVAPADELKRGELKPMTLRGRAIVLARAEHGYAAFDDRCSHDGAPLGEAVMQGDTIRCRCGSQFDVMTGRVAGGPAQHPIRTYAVEERNGRVCVTLDDQLKGG